MAQDKIAFRYAKAIFDYLKDANKLRALIAEFKEFQTLIEGNAELVQVLTTEIYSEEERRGVVEDLVAKTSLSNDTKRILVVLSNAKRVGHLGLIADRLGWLMLEAANIIPLNVETATSLETDEKKKIEEKFQSLLGKKVEASYHVEPALIGGLKVVAGGRTYDGSLAGWLESFQENANVHS